MNDLGIRWIAPTDLRAALHSEREIALLDVREEGVFSRKNLLLSSCLPLSRLETRIGIMVPRRATRVVFCDENHALAILAATRASAMGYTNVQILKGGIAAWEQCGFPVYSGVHVVSKSFAEVIEHARATPSISPDEFNELRESNASMSIIDTRTRPEYLSGTIPGAQNVPGGEHVYRFFEVVDDPSRLVVVTCGGRTRSIIGAQTLREAGVPNRVVALRNGTMGWHLGGRALAEGKKFAPHTISERAKSLAQAAAARVACRYKVESVTESDVESWKRDEERTLYIFNVTTREEYEASHFPGAIHAPGGQLLQETDNFIATRGARVIVTDNDGVRAMFIAAWLIQMGHGDVYVLVAGRHSGQKGPGPTAAPNIAPSSGIQTVKPEMLLAEMRDRAVVVVDFSTSRNYSRGHIPGAIFAIRSMLTPDLSEFASRSLVFTSEDGVLAQYAASDFPACGGNGIRVLAGGNAAWNGRNLPWDTEASTMLHPPEDIWYSPKDRGADRDQVMREYLAWELGLVEQVCRDPDTPFRAVIEELKAA